MIKQGDKGDEVKQLQTRLGLAADGDFGPRTKAAVIAFQSAHGLAADGIVGDATHAALFATPAPVTDPRFTADGWYKAARRVPAHPGRVGAVIDAKSIVAHTTDCTRGSMAGILKRWAEEIGLGDCANFMIGRGPADAADAAAPYPGLGLVQMVPITHNANHAGGARKVNGQWIQWHGNYVINGVVTHPNTCTVGIEVDNAGRLVRMTGGWVHADSGRAWPLDSPEIFVDSRGKGWERVSDWQLITLGDLIEALDDQLAHFPDGVTLKPNGDYAGNGALDAIVKGTRLVGHWTLDPNNKTDPGPQVMTYLRARFGI